MSWSGPEICGKECLFLTTEAKLYLRNKRLLISTKGKYPAQRHEPLRVKENARYLARCPSTSGKLAPQDCT